MQVTEFIGRQLKKEYLNNLPVKVHQNIDSICCFSGQKINEGVLKKDLIKDVIKFLYDKGIGKKTSYGLGMIEGI